MTLTYATLRGEAVIDALDALSHLRMAVFRDWPYLYNGNLDSERRYLTRYADAPRSILVGAFDAGRLVGMATGSPMQEHAAEYAGLFERTGEPLETMFYCAESVLLPACRGRGAGHRFFDAREAHARDLGFTYAAFCSVVRPADHPMRPADARTHDAFWRGHGYAPLDGIFARSSWTDVNEASKSEKHLQFWGKSL